MRKIRKYLAGILFISVIFIGNAVISFTENTYDLKCNVISNRNNEVVFKDFKNQLWVYDTDDSSFREGDLIKVTFHNNYTDHNRNDDLIVSINKI